ncbi:putative Transcription initiation factor TFIID subunit 3 protein [Naja naja]|nr:putative Transcription initiation factor TFIID subunit 3 protein [Naja naja]
MSESYSRWLLRVSVAQVCQALGWDSVQLSACDLLTDVLQRYLHSLGRGCRRYCELCECGPEAQGGRGEFIEINQEPKSVS